MEGELRLGRRTSEATGACLVRQRLTSREHSPVRQHVGPGQAVTRARGVHETRIYSVQYLPADAEPVHDPGREILDQYVAALDHAKREFAATLMLEIQGDRALVGVQHRDRKRRA